MAERVHQRCRDFPMMDRRSGQPCGDTWTQAASHMFAVLAYSTSRSIYTAMCERMYESER